MLLKNNDVEIEYTLTNKSSKVVLILTGVGGAPQGYENKYETIKNYLREDYNVFVAISSSGVWKRPREHFDFIINFVKETMADDTLTIYVFGNSAGGTIALWYSHSHPCIKRIVAVNPVLQINPHRINDGVKLFCNEFVKIIFGEKDISFAFAQLIKPNNKLEIISIPHADHSFTGVIDRFIELPIKYLLD